jgi:hypothetical protein
MEHLPGLLMVERGDAGTVVRAKNDDVLMGQAGQYAPNVTASSAEHLRQTFFGKTTGGIDSLFENGIENPRIKIIRWRGEGQGGKRLR